MDNNGITDHALWLKNNDTYQQLVQQENNTLGRFYSYMLNYKEQINPVVTAYEYHMGYDKIFFLCNVLANSSLICKGLTDNGSNYSLRMNVNRGCLSKI